MTDVRTKRIYEDPDPADGYRVLVDRLWPRGVSKEEAELDEWCKEVAPSDELRKWFDHDPDRWEEFRERYRNELNERRSECRQLIDRCDGNRLSLLYAAKDTEHNHARVLRDELEELDRQGFSE